MYAFNNKHNPREPWKTATELQLSSTGGVAWGHNFTGPTFLGKGVVLHKYLEATIFNLGPVF